MKLKKVSVVIILMLIFCAVGTISSYASYTAGNKTVNSGETFSITVTSSTDLDAYNLDLNSYNGLTFQSCSKSETGAVIQINGGSIGYMNASGSTKTLGTYNFKAPSVTADTTYTINFKVDQSTTVTSTVTVKAPVVNPPVNNTTQDPVTPTKSSNANLSNLGIRPNDFTGFKSGTTSYSVSVPYSVKSIEVYANKGESSQTISGTGTKSLNEGSNVFNVNVTAEDGTKKTYTVTVVRLAEEVQNNPDVIEAPEIKVALTSLTIENGKINEAFSPEKTEYTADVNFDVTELKVNAVANAQDATIDIKYPEEIKEDEDNIITITVKSKDGKDSKVYTIKVKKLADTNAIGATDDNQNIVDNTIINTDPEDDNKKSLSIQKIIFIIVAAGIAIVGITFAVLDYTSGRKESLETVDFSGLNSEEDIKINTNKDIVENDTSEEQINKNEDGESSDKVRTKGRHF